jgi:hypothetical protein
MTNNYLKLPGDGQVNSETVEIAVLDQLPGKFVHSSILLGRHPRLAKPVFSLSLSLPPPEESNARGEERARYLISWSLSMPEAGKTCFFLSLSVNLHVSSQQTS